MLLLIEAFFQSIYLTKRYFPLDLSNSKNTSKKIIPNTFISIIHPGVGHSHTIRDFQINPNSKNLKFNKLSLKSSYGNHPLKKTFLILGGSTTDPLGTQFSGYRGTWDIHLFEKLEKELGIQFNVINAGRAGSTSSDELKRLITFIHGSPIDYVISNNGINEIYFSDVEDLKEYTNVLSSRIVTDGLNRGIIKGEKGIYININNPFESLRSLFLIGIRKLRTYQILSKLNNKSPYLNKNINMDSKLSLEYAAERWLINTRLMHSVSSEFNIKYFVFLQPTLGLDISNKSQIKSFEDKFPNLRKIYLERINYLYKYLRKHCSSLTYCFDISKDQNLTLNPNLYTDPRHPNSDGNKEIAAEMTKYLKLNIK